MRKITLHDHSYDPSSLTCSSSSHVIRIVPPWASWSPLDFYGPHTKLTINPWFSWSPRVHISQWSFACSVPSPHDFIILMIPHGPHDLHMDSWSPHDPHDSQTNLMISTWYSCSFTWSAWSSHESYDLHMILMLFHMIRMILLWSLRCPHDRPEPHVSLKCDPTLNSASFLILKWS